MVTCLCGEQGKDHGSWLAWGIIEKSRKKGPSSPPLLLKNETINFNKEHNSIVSSALFIGILKTKQKNWRQNGVSLNLPWTQSVPSSPQASVSLYLNGGRRRVPNSPGCCKDQIIYIMNLALYLAPFLDHHQLLGRGWTEQTKWYRIYFMKQRKQVTLFSTFI